MHISDMAIQIKLIRYYSAVLKAVQSGDLAQKMELREHGHPLRYLTKRQACLLYADLFGSIAPVKKKTKIGDTKIDGFVQRRLTLIELARYASRNLGYAQPTTQAQVSLDLHRAKTLVRKALIENIRGEYEESAISSGR